MQILNPKNPEKSALKYKNTEVYISTYKISTTLQQIAKNRGLTFQIDVNDIVKNPYIFSKVKMFISLCNKYNVEWHVFCSETKWKQRSETELYYVSLLLGC